MPTRTKLSALTAVLSASTLLLSGLAAAPQAGAATLYACVKKKGGAARFVSARTNCRRGETKLSWNTQGVPGRNGSNGKNGPAGKNGTNGKNGTDGKAGVNGANGANGASAAVVDFSDSPFELPLTRTAVATAPEPAGRQLRPAGQGEARRREPDGRRGCALLSGRRRSGRRTRCQRRRRNALAVWRQRQPPHCKRLARMQRLRHRRSESLLRAAHRHPGAGAQRNERLAIAALRPGRS